MGRRSLSALLVLRACFLAALCSLVLFGKVHAQEVIVARETKSKAPEQAASPSEQPPSESPAPARTKPKAREKKSGSTTVTAEQMRMAGALAAERLENRGSPQPARTRESDSEPAVTEAPIVSGTPRPVKEEARAGQGSVSRRSGSRTPKPEPIGAVRPTMMESGRQEPSATPSGKPEARGEHTPTP
jgi:hypothetical protein